MRLFRLLSFSLCCLFSWCGIYAQQQDYTQYVNPFIGTAFNGHTFPGACMPFGLVQAGPVTGVIGWKYCSEYVYGDTSIMGFSQTRLNGTGCADLGDVLITPVTAQSNHKSFASHYLKASETAHPGYYSVMLDGTGVKVELTATPHVAYHRYTYINADSSAILIDLQNAPAWDENAYHSHVKACELNWENDHTLSGHVRTSIWVEKDVYFVISFSRPMKRMANLPLAGKDKGNKILVSFSLKPGDCLEAKVALSSASVAGAFRNLAAELPLWDFNATVQKATATWNSYLARIDVDGSPAQKVNFYTSFYHALIQPNNIADVDGAYRNAKNELASAIGGEFYSTLSLWDTYRAAHPFYTLFVPEKVNAFVSSMVSQAEVQGFLPIWALWGKENFCMIGNHGVAVVAEAFHKGFRGFDTEKAYEMVKRSLTVSHPTKSDWETYMKYGYYPTDLIKDESVSCTLEQCYDDYAAADMARLMGKKADARYFSRRALFYKNLFDPSTRFMRPRNSDGSWRSPFSPDGLTHAGGGGGDYTEGNAWQYTWHVQQDVPGLIALMGGNAPFVAKLDSLFTLKLHSTLVDVTGLIGQYAHGNEPSHHIAYLYALAGQPERTQELVRQICDTEYLPKPDGLCGNDDCGQMSAWYMFSAMGFYPVNPVSAQYVFGAPQIPAFTLHLPGGKTFTIRAQGLSSTNLHVARILLNGKPYKKSYIDHATITAGGTLTFVMKP